MASHSTGRRPRGFTLVEATLAISIVGLGVLSMLQLFAACHQTASAGQDLTAGQFLAAAVQEATAGVGFVDPVAGGRTFGPEAGETLATYDDIDDFAGLTLSPPVDGLRRPLPDMAGYRQEVLVVPVLPDYPGGNTDEANPSIEPGTWTGAVRVTVRVLKAADDGPGTIEVFSLSWIRMSP